MPTPSYDMITFSGVFGSQSAPVEIWSTGMKIEPGTTSDIENLEGVASVWAAAWSGGLRAVMPATTILTRVRVSKHNPGGAVSQTGAGQYAQGDWNGVTPGTGSASAPIYPLQTAIVVSLQTDRAGAPGKGRMFLPAPAVALGGDFVLPQAGAELVRDRFLQTLAAASTVPHTLVVASSKGFRSPVTSVRVGRVLDTMRSRRNGQVEGYVSAPIP